MLFDSLLLKAKKMENKIQIKNLKGGSLFRLLIIGNTLFFIPLSIVMGVGNYFGFCQPILFWKGKPLTGLIGLIVSPFSGAFFAIGISGFLCFAIFIGLRIYTKFRPVELKFVPFSQIENE